MMHVYSCFKLIRELGLVLGALALLFSSHEAYAQSSKKYVKIVFDSKDVKSKKKQAKTVQNKYGPQRIPASLQASPTHGNIVHVQDYVTDLEGLDAPKKAIVPKNKKPLAEDVEISRDMIIAN